VQTISRRSIWFQLAFYFELVFPHVKSPFAKVGVATTITTKYFDDDTIGRLPVSVSLCSLFWRIVFFPLKLFVSIFTSMVFITIAIMFSVLLAIFLWKIASMIPSSIDWSIRMVEGNGLTAIAWLVGVGIVSYLIGLIVKTMKNKVATQTMDEGWEILVGRIKAFKEKYCPILEIKN